MRKKIGARRELRQSSNSVYKIATVTNVRSMQSNLLGRIISIELVPPDK